MLMDETMGSDTSLFDAGGDSLLAAELLVALKAAVPTCFLPELSMRALLTTPSPAGLAAVLRSAVPSASDHTAAAPTMDGPALERLLLQVCAAAPATHPRLLDHSPLSSHVALRPAGVPASAHGRGDGGHG